MKINAKTCIFLDCGTEDQKFYGELQQIIKALKLAPRDFQKSYPTVGALLEELTKELARSLDEYGEMTTEPNESFQAPYCGGTLTFEPPKDRTLTQAEWTRVHAGIDAFWKTVGPMSPDLSHIQDWPAYSDHITFGDRHGEVSA